MNKKNLDNFIDNFIKEVGSTMSLILHSLFFIFCIIAGLIWGYWDSILLVLTTVVSLEAIYLAIFIQWSINRNTESLKGVEKDIDEIQEDVEEIADDVDEIQEDVEDLQEEDEEEESEEEQGRRLLKDIQDNIIKINIDIEQLKKNR